eukprot:scaffold21769_cov41-Phaeocystis_antarctica.AAC.1
MEGIMSAVHNHNCSHCGYHPPALARGTVGERSYAATRAVWECIATACARGLPLHKRITSLPTVLESADYREGCFSVEISFLAGVSTKHQGS